MSEAATEAKAEYTPTPWRHHVKPRTDRVNGGEFWPLHGKNGQWIGDIRCGIGHDARRIVACVNFCEGTRTESLEVLTKQKNLNLERTVAGNLRAESADSKVAELRAALEATDEIDRTVAALKECCPPDPSNPDPGSIEDCWNHLGEFLAGLRDALATTEGGGDE